MTRNQSEAAPVGTEFKCPNCGDTNVYYQEMTPTVCSIKIVKGELHVDGSSYDYIFESAGTTEGKELLCRSCVHEFPVPKGMKVEWV